MFVSTHKFLTVALCCTYRRHFKTENGSIGMRLLLTRQAGCAMTSYNITIVVLEKGKLKLHCLS